MLIFRSRGFIQQHLVIRNRIQKLAVQAPGRNQIHRDSQRIFQVSGQTAKLQAADGSFINAQIDVAVFVCIPSGIGVEQINPVYCRFLFILSPPTGRGAHSATPRCI